MITGIEAMALQATDLLYASRAAQQIISLLVAANNRLMESSSPVNPDEVKRALDMTSVAIDSVERKMHECAKILSDLNNPAESGILFTYDFPGELKKRAEVLSLNIQNLKDVFSLVENTPSWKPYFSALQSRKKKAIRSVSNLRNAYLNIALLAEQHTSPVPTVESSVEGLPDEFSSAVAASNHLLGLKQSEWC